MDEDSGQCTHHAVTSLDVRIKPHLDLDVSFVWDYLQHHKPQSNGDIPQTSDFHLTVGLGYRF